MKRDSKRAVQYVWNGVAREIREYRIEKLHLLLHHRSVAVFARRWTAVDAVVTMTAGRRDPLDLDLDLSLNLLPLTPY